MSQPAAPASPNFDFLTRYDRTLVAVPVMAEQYFAQDPVTCLMKLRQFGKQLAQQVAARAGVLGAPTSRKRNCSAAFAATPPIPATSSTCFTICAA